MTSKHHDSPNKLTEFAPLSSEVKQSGGFFYRLFKKNNDESSNSEVRQMPAQQEFYTDVSDELEKRSTASGSGSAASSREGGRGLSSREVTPQSDSRGSSPALHDQTEETRTLPVVLKRLGNILDRRSQTPQAYKDSDFKQYWMPDENCKQCYECGERFYTLRRRHHCRICGQIFCSRCCNQEVPGKIMGYTGSLRVCTYCCKVVLSYAQNSDSRGDLCSLQEDLNQQLNSSDAENFPGGQASGYQELNAPFWSNTVRRKTSRSTRPTSTIFDEDSKPRVGGSPDGSSTPTLRPFDITSPNDYPSTARIQQERKVLLQDSTQLRDLWLGILHPTDGIEMQSHRHHLRTYQNCLLGSEIIDWLLNRDKANSRFQAVVLAQALLDAQWIECVTSTDPVFKAEYVLYRPGKLASLDTVLDTSAIQETASIAEGDAEPLWFKEIEGENDYDSEENVQLPASGNEELPVANGGSLFNLDHRQQEREEAASKYRRYKAFSLNSVESGKLDSVDGGPGLRPHNGDGGIPGIKERSQRGESGGEAGEASPNPLYQRHQSVSAGLVGITESPTITGAFAASETETVSVEVETPSGWQENEQLREENGERLAFDRISKAQKEHLTTLTRQLLCRDGLSLKWTDTILGIVGRISQIVRPDVRNDNDEMDIRQYIQIKKIAGGNRANTTIVHGVVCSKNVAHKKMCQHIVNPKVLLLKAPIEYQRVENKFSSLEPQILQEHEFLKNCVGRIMSLDPDILLVEKTVSRVAQEFLLDSGVTLVINVKPSVMERVARFTTADIVTSIDGLVSPNALGFCHAFKIQTFNLNDGCTKTLMYFDGCAHHLGCTVTLRGGSVSELKRVKQIMHFMCYATYHARLEMSFMMDEFAMPPAAPDETNLDIIAPGCGSPTKPEGALPSGEQESQPTGNRNARQDKLEKAKGRFSRDTEDDVEIFKSSSREQSAERKKARSREHSKDRALSSSGDQGEGSGFSKDWEERDGKSTTKTKRASRSSTTAVTDLSDPLQNYQISKDETIFHGKESLREVHKNSSMKFKKALEDVILTTSPYIRYEIPYLETDVGSKCKLRSFFGPVLYWSRHIHEDPEKRNRAKFIDEESEHPALSSSVRMKEPHPFVYKKITAPISDPSTQALLADFRARGGTIELVAPKENKGENNRAEPESSSTSWERRLQVDCLDPYRHQRLAVLFSSFSYDSTNHPNPCVNPWVVSMDYYGRNDITLGGFLERYCFRETYQCPSETCDTPMVDHIRRFVHENGCLQVILKKLDTPMPGYPNNILMWGWCRKCKQVTPVVPMSIETWSMSFAKYLELRYHGHPYGRRASAEPCIHSLHHDHYQYFGFKHVVTSFKYSPISLKEICLPPIVIQLTSSEVPPDSLEKDVKQAMTKGTGVYSAILENLYRLKGDAQSEGQTANISELIKQLQGEKDEFWREVEQLEAGMKGLGIWQEASNPASPSSEAMKTIFSVQDLLVEVKRLIATAVSKWNNKLQDLELQRRRLEKSGGISRTDSTRWSTSNLKEGDELSSLESEPTFVVEGESLITSVSLAASHLSEASFGSDPDLTINPSHFGGGSSSNTPETSSLGEGESPAHNPCPEYVSSASSKGSEKGHARVASADDLDGVSRSTANNESLSHGRSKSLGETRKALKLTSNSREDKDKTIVKQIFSSLLSSSETPSIAMPFPLEEHYLLPPGDNVPMAIYDSEPSSIIAYTLSSSEYAIQLAELKTYLNKEGNPSPNPGRKTADQTGSEGDGGDMGNKKSSVLSFFRGGSSVVSRERSPGRRDGTATYEVEAVKYTPRSDRDSVEEAEEADFLYTGTTEAEKSKGAIRQPEPLNYNIELQFSDNSTKFYCRVYYAEQFRKLRKLIFPDGEERYIRSLSRCFTWLARGGKSGSTFCKTQDDRFILKQMSRYEVQSFVEFAPHYFQYITKAYTEKKPTILAKIVGVYKIGYRNSQTTTALKQDVLVMENLFYNRKITQIFDLKGSVRNRLVNTPGKNVEDLVLLDENLLKSSVDNPLYIRPHSKTVLSIAINNDSQFLSANLVMDYSLLVGLDETTKELVIGIIDYIRTFTWDKKLEFIAKSFTLGGQGKMPTVVSPELYRSRFIEAMDQYFLPVPDRWSGLGRNVDC